MQINFVRSVVLTISKFRYDKDTILQTFANEVFIAQDGDRAIHGFGLASQYFFNRPLSELQPHQYSLLIGMLKAPTSYNPVRRPERATARRNLVLKIMHDDELLDDTALASAQLQPLDVNSAAHNTGGNPAYLDAVRRQLMSEYALEDLQNTGLRIFTNYDPLLQYAAEQSVAATLSDIQSRYGAEKIPDEFLEAALVLTDPNTGEIKALIGGRHSRYAGFNRALDAYRPVGSLLKPAVFLTAWSRPDEYTLSTIIDDEPVTLAQHDGSIWTPKNFNQAFEGPVPAIYALSRSLNLATVNLGLALGVDKVINTINNLGIKSKLPEIPALLLGAHGFTVMDMARMYQTIAADGFSAPLRTIREVIDSEGHTLSQYSLDVTREIDPASLYLLKYAMTETMLTGTGKSVYNLLPDQFYVAGKTGTSDKQRDSWFAGFSGDYLAVVWLGNDENQPTPLTGSSGALKVWSKLFSQISRKGVDFTPPSNVSYHAIDLTVNKRVPARCRSPLELPYTEGSEPKMGKRCHSSESALGSWIKSLLR